MIHKSMAFFILPKILTALLILSSVNVSASIITTNPQLPPNQCVGGYCVYRFDPTQVHARWNILGLGFLDLTNTLHSGFINVVRNVIGNNEVENFDSTVSTSVRLSGTGVQYDNIQLHGAVQTEVYDKVGQVSGSFNTEMLALNLTGTTPLGHILIRESPTLASIGQTTIMDIGGGRYQINSFFDIFLELSVDGGNTWLIQEDGSTRVDLACIPIPSTLWLFGSALVSFSLTKRYRVTNKVS